MTEFKGKVALDIRDSVPDWAPYLPPQAPEGAPNVLLIAWDDLGYGTMDVFGGPVETPTMRRIADMGRPLRATSTPRRCARRRAPPRSPAATRRPTAWPPSPSSAPASRASRPASRSRTGSSPRCSAERGWNTYCVGKWHLTPGEEANLAAFKGRWPLGRGFERFYGFLGGESNQWYPDLVYDNHHIDPPATPEDGYHLSKDLADKAIEFIRDAKVDRPRQAVLHVLLAPGCGHAPHHVFKEWADRYKGRFDQGYEAIRAEILQRAEGPWAPARGHRALAHQPPRLSDDGARTASRGRMLDRVRPWDSLTSDEQRLFARMAEVFAGFVSYTDDQLGRVIDYLEESGQLENTIIVVVSDNGASAEGGPNGSFNEWRFFNGDRRTRSELNLPHIDELGSPASYNHYNTGWAWAFDTPFPYWKRFAGYEGGVADMCVVAWPARSRAQAEVRQQYLHAVDVVPTLYELVGVEPPAS